MRQLNENVERQHVADEIDLANDMLDIQISRAVAKAAGLEIPVNKSGRCLYCDEPLNEGRRWCNADCRELFEHEHRKN